MNLQGLKQQREIAAFNHQRDLKFIGIPSALGYVDSVQLSLRQLIPVEQLRRLKEAGAGGVVPERSKHKGRPFNLRIHQPTHAALELATAIAPDHIVNRLDIALDFLTGDISRALDLQHFLRSYLTQKRHGGSHVFKYRDTVYFRPAWLKRNIVLYPEIRSRHDGNPGLHLEFRFYGRAACRKLGVEQLADVPNIRPLSIVQDQCRLTRVDVEKVTHRIQRMADQIATRMKARARQVSAKAILGKVIAVITHATQCEPNGVVSEARLCDIPSQEWIDAFPKLIRRAVCQIPLIKETNWPGNRSIFLR